MTEPRLDPIEEVLINHSTRKNHDHFLDKVTSCFVNNSFESFFQSDSFGQVIFCNNLFAEQLGYTFSEEILNHSCEELFHSHYKIIADRLQENGEVKKFPVVLNKRDGSLFYGITNAIIQEEDGEFTYNWAILDISNYMEFQEKIKIKSEELAKVNEQMEKFLYRASHDLRSPVASIAGLMNLIRMESTSKPIDHYLDCVNISVQKLEGAIRDIVGFSKARYQYVSNEQIHWHSLLERIVNKNRHVLDLRGIEMDIQIDDEAVFFSDRDRLMIILDHLLRNSINYYDQRKRNPFVRIALRTTTEKATIHLFDNGIGIESQHLDAIFGMFYRGSDRIYGPGLGLYIVKESLSCIDGVVSVESVFGKGTTFRIEIPNNKYQEGNQTSMFS